jgi:hypothetical protein
MTNLPTAVAQSAPMPMPAGGCPQHVDEEPSGSPGSKVVVPQQAEAKDHEGKRHSVVQPSLAGQREPQGLGFCPLSSCAHSVPRELQVTCLHDSRIIAICRVLPARECTDEVKKPRSRGDPARQSMSCGVFARRAWA